MNLLQIIAGQIPTTPDEAMTWVNVIKDAGGWGVALIEGYVILKLYGQARGDRDEVIKIIREQNQTVNNTVSALKAGGQ